MITFKYQINQPVRSQNARQLWKTARSLTKLPLNHLQHRQLLFSPAHHWVLLNYYIHVTGFCPNMVKTWNSPIDCIEGFIEVFHGRVQHSKTIVVEDVKPIMTSNTNRNNYPDNRLVVRGIWTEGGRRNVTALQSAHIIDYAQYMLSQQNTDMLSIQEIFTVLRNLRRKVCRKGMVTLGLTHKASSCSRRRNRVEWEGDCVCMLRMCVHVAHVCACCACVCAHTQPLQGAAECLVAVECYRGPATCSMEGFL